MAGAPLTKRELEDLLDAQTQTILTAVDERLLPIRSDIGELKTSMNKLVNTLDAFLKRLTTLEDGFEAVKYELNRIKTFLKEKLDFEPE